MPTSVVHLSLFVFFLIGVSGGGSVGSTLQQSGRNGRRFRQRRRGDAGLAPRRFRLRRGRLGDAAAAARQRPAACLPIGRGPRCHQQVTATPSSAGYPIEKNIGSQIVKFSDRFTCF